MLKTQKRRGTKLTKFLVNQILSDNIYLCEME